MTREHAEHALRYRDALAIGTDELALGRALPRRIRHVVEGLGKRDDLSLLLRRSRYVLFRDYFGVDLDVVCDVALRKVPVILPALRDLRRSMDPAP